MSLLKIRWETVQTIFKRPLYASITVGTLVHVFNALNEVVASGQASLASWNDSITTQPLYTAFGFAIPYLVAGLVTRASQYAGPWHAEAPEAMPPAFAPPQRRRLDLISSQLSSMIDLLDDTFSQYNPQTFDIAAHEQRMFHALLATDTHQTHSGPTHLFHVNWGKDALSGHVYFMDGQEIFQSMRPINIPIQHDHYAIFSGCNDVKVQNWEDLPEDLATFQKHFHPAVRRIVGTIERYVTYRSGNVAIIAFYRGRKLDWHDALALKGLTTFSQSLHRIAMESQETEQAFRYLVDTLSRASEVNDEDTGAHIHRINEYSRELAAALGTDKAFIETIHYSAQMHDVGKIHVHPDILKKPGALTPAEYEQMKAHCTYGTHILGDSPRLSMAREIALHHHEKYNGRGYPLGLRGEAIPLAARIVALVDVYDALRQARVYKPAFSHEEAMKIITQGDGRTCPDDFDPAVLQAFLCIEATMNSIYHDHPG